MTKKMQLIMKAIILVILFLLSPLILALESSCDDHLPVFYMVYEIKEGDNLIGIAKDFNCSVAGLCWTNGLMATDIIKAGEELIIPPKPLQEIPPFRAKINPIGEPCLKLRIGRYPVCFYHDLPDVKLSSDKVMLYHIRAGDTLYDLAREFNTTVAFLQALNNMELVQIKQGQRIYLPINNLTPRQILMKTINNEDLDLLARTIYGEARGEPYIGQVAVGAVVVNRVLSHLYPNNIHGVVYQPEQFNCVTDGQLRLTPNQMAFDAAKEALAGVDPTRGAMYYYNPKTAVRTWWLETREVTVVIGNHRFLR